MAIWPSSSLVVIENKLIKELEVILNQEHELWALKSRVNWMVQGDQNTAFYHVSTIVRRNRNCITAIKNSVGEWINEEEEVMGFNRNGFCNIYSSSHSFSLRDPSQDRRRQAWLSNEEKDSLSKRVTIEEIEAGLWSQGK